MYRKIGSASLEDFPEIIKVKQCSVKKELQKQKKVKSAHKDELNKKLSVSKLQYVSKRDNKVEVISSCSVSVSKESEMSVATVKADNTPNKVSKYKDNGLNNKEAEHDILRISKTVSNANNNEADQQRYDKGAPSKKHKSKSRTNGKNVQSNKSLQLPPGVRSRSKVFRNKDRVVCSANNSNTTNSNNHLEKSAYRQAPLIKKPTDINKSSSKPIEILKPVTTDIAEDKLLSHTENSQTQAANIWMKINVKDIKSDFNFKPETELMAKSLAGIKGKRINNNKSSEKCEIDTNLLYSTNKKYFKEVTKQKLTNLNTLNKNKFPINVEHSKVLEIEETVSIPKFTIKSRINSEVVKKVIHPHENSARTQQDADLKIAIAEKFNSNLNHSSKKHCVNLVENESQYHQPNFKECSFIPNTRDTFDCTMLATSTEETHAFEFKSSKPKHAVSNSVSKPNFKLSKNFKKLDQVDHQLTSNTTPEINRTTKLKESKTSCESTPDTYIVAPISRKTFIKSKQQQKSAGTRVHNVDSNSKMLPKSHTSPQVTEPNKKIFSPFSVLQTKLNIPKEFAHSKRKKRFKKVKKRYQIIWEASRISLKSSYITHSRSQQRCAVPENSLFNTDVKAKKTDNIKTKNNATTKIHSTVNEPVDNVTDKQKCNNKMTTIKYVDCLENSLEYNIDFENNKTIRINGPKVYESFQNNMPKKEENLHTTPQDYPSVRSTKTNESFENNLLKKVVYQDAISREDYLPQSTNTYGLHDLHNKHEKEMKSNCSNLLSLGDNGIFNEQSTTKTVDYSLSLKLNNAMNKTVLRPNTKTFHMQQPENKQNYGVTKSEANTTTIQTTPLFFDGNRNNASRILYNNYGLSSQNHNNIAHNPYQNNDNSNETDRKCFNQFDSNNNTNSSRPLPEQPTTTENSQLGNPNLLQSRYTEHVEHNMTRSQACHGHFRNNNFELSNLSPFLCICNAYPVCPQIMFKNVNTSQFLFNNTYRRPQPMMANDLASYFSALNTYPNSSHFGNTRLSSSNTTNSVYSQMTVRGTPILNPTNNVFIQGTPIASFNILGPTQLLFHQRYDMNIQQASSVLRGSINAGNKLNFSTSNSLSVGRPILGRGVRQLLKIDESDPSTTIKSLPPSTSAGKESSSYSQKK